jgi:predicted ATPase
VTALDLKRTLPHSAIATNLLSPNEAEVGDPVFMDRLLLEPAIRIAFLSASALASQCNE